MIGVIVFPYVNYIIYSNGIIFNTKTETFIKGINNGNGYLFVNLWNNGKRSQQYIHKLVAVGYIDNIKNLKYIDHIDRNKTNNNYTNLRWVSASENTKNIAGKSRYSAKRICIHKKHLIPNVIQLHKQGKRVMQISRELNIP